MDPNVQQPQQQVTQSATQQALHQEMPHSSLPKMLWIALGVIVVTGLVGGAYYLGIKKEATVVSNETTSKPTVVSPTVMVTQAASSTAIPTVVDTTANWQTYTANMYSIKYPNTWKLKSSVNPTDSSVIFQNFYDPTSLIACNPAHCSGSVPTRYIDITTQISSQTAKQYADKVTSDPLYKNEGSVEQQVTLNGIAGYMYKEAGEGSQGYDIVVSNGKTLVKINIPYSDITQDLTVNQILQSFKFTQ